MARLLSQTLVRDPVHALARLPSAASVLVGGRRGRSSRPEKVELVEVEIEAESPETELLGARRLEEAIHRVLARRSAPEWLPFVPGASYWVPPPRPLGRGRRRRGRALGLVEIVGAHVFSPMTEEEELSFTTARGWPSSEYFVEGEIRDRGVSPHTVKSRPEVVTILSDDEES
ncbi:hypothetical protein ACMD2_07232 [Ananas comosus]|uniref:Uncharacterized protein n=1 Tax=Ananas comosus TaxID=4615 RepID=A0A199VJJ3_ANACO|nr:hypothetical protein ACMD2_07222 [Ananas comosus]OAY77061.1 hypothetical protein ACMD2_07232 [Ananas comosus]